MEDNPFTVFYAWQSDTAARDNRNFLQAAIEKSLKEVKASGVVDAAPRLDSDTKDVPGIPDIANTILQKIRSASALIADLTFVGAQDPTTDDAGKLLPNPNVMIELGYALAELGWERIICVMNTHYGGQEHLPFDLRNRRWPIAYDLPSDADADTRATKKTALSTDLFRALTDIAKLQPRPRHRDLDERLQALERIVAAIGTTAPQLTRLEERLIGLEGALAHPRETEEDATENAVRERLELIRRVKSDEFEGIAVSQGMLIMTVVPQQVTERPLPLQSHEHELRVRLRPFYAGGWDHRRRGDRFITFSKWEQRIDAVTEITDGGLIRAVGHEVISVNRRYFQMGDAAEDIHFIPSVAFEKSVVEAVHSYLSLYNDLGVDPPFVICVGMINLRKSGLVVGPSVFPDGRVLTEDEVLPPPVTITERSEYESPQSAARALRPIFDYIWREYDYPCSLNYSQSGEWVGH